MTFAGAVPETALLERAAELSALDAAFDAGGRLVLLAGEAGVGKTSLLRRFCARAATARILWGDCDALFTLSALGPLTDIAAATGGELADLVDAGRPPHEVAAALLGELARRDPAIVVFEDVHWADEATLDVLRLLGRRVATVPALVVASYRDDELDRAHPLRITLGELSRCDATERLRLAPLSERAVAELAAAARRRRRAALPPDGREPVLRDRGAGRRRRGAAGDGPRRRPRPGHAAEPARAQGARRGRDRAGHRRAAAAGGAGRRRRDAARGVPVLRRARGGRQRRRLPARSRSRRGRGDASPGPPLRAAPAGARRLGRSRGACPPRLPRRRRGRRRGGAALRAGRRRARGVQRRAPRGRGPVRTGAALRRRTVAGGARRAARAPLARVLRDRPVRGGDRGPARRAGVPPAARRPPRRG